GSRAMARSKPTDHGATSLHRRRVVTAIAAAGALGMAPRLALAGSGAPGCNGFVRVIVRGGMDGLAAAPAIGDPDYAAARGPLANLGAAPLALDATFAPHPNLGGLHPMVRNGDA